MKGVITYTLLVVWTVVCLFPLYWLLITSFKQPIAVFQGPKYFPWIDFKPTLSAWQFLLAKPAIDAVYQRPPAAGWGFFVCLLGLAIVAVAAVSQAPGASIRGGKSWPDF